MNAYLAPVPEIRSYVHHISITYTRLPHTQELILLFHINMKRNIFSVESTKSIVLKDGTEAPSMQLDVFTVSGVKLMMAQNSKGFICLSHA